MWFDDDSIDEKLIKPILKVRPLIEAYYKSEAYFKSAGKVRTLLTPQFKNLHFGYSIKFESIKDGFKLPGKPTTQRILEHDANGPIAFHVLTVSNKKPELLESMVNEKKINDFFEALKKIQEKVKDETKGKIRFLTVPSLNAKSVWLHFDEPGNDGFSLITRFGPKDDELMGETKYKKYLDERKKEVEAFAKITGGLEDEKSGG
jgi:hypothetical protein